MKGQVRIQNPSSISRKSVLNFPKKSGYTILELSIVLLILGIITLGLIGVFSFGNRINSHTLTESRMDIIQNAFVSFVAANGRLPCPAVWGLDQTNQEFGYEASMQTIILNCNSNLLINSSGAGQPGDTIYLGMVPINTLGLNPEYAFDGYGDRFGYVVGFSSVNSSLTTSQNLGAEGTNLECEPPSEESLSDACFGRQLVDFGRNRIEILNDVDGDLINFGSAYVLISYGANSNGAFPKGADQTIDENLLIDRDVPRNSYPTSAKELENLECTNLGSCAQNMLDMQFVQSGRDSSFDDIVRFDTRNSIIVKCNEFSNNICTDQVNGHGMQLDS